MKHPVDVGSLAAYVAGGGLAGVFVFIGTLYPQHASQLNGGAIALVALAGAIRVIFNPTPPSGTAMVVSSSTPPTPGTLETNPAIAAPPQKVQP